MINFKYKIKEDILTKTALYISSQLKQFNCGIYIITTNNLYINAQSSIGLISANLKKDDIITLQIEDAKNKLDIQKLFEEIAIEVI